MERFANNTPLLPENDATFWRIWQWLRDRGFTDKESPQVGSEECDGAYHIDGLISIDEVRHYKEDFPLPAVMLEELLHYIATTDDQDTSADFSAEFLHRTLDIIIARLMDEPRERKRAFQDTLIGSLWKLVEGDLQSQPRAGQ